MKKIILTALLISGLNSFAQDNSETSETSKTSISLGLDIQSRYIWRGLQLGGNSASAQPSIEISKGQFSVGAWGAYNLGGTGNGNEADLYVTYAPSEKISFTVTDYFFPSEGNNQGYFPYNKGHVFEAMVSLSATEKFPIDITVATNFGGTIKYIDGSKEKSAYSTYVEISYEKTIKDKKYNIFAGGVFADDNSYYLTDGSGFINLGLSVSKEIKITDSFSLPVNAALIFNPDQENIFLTFGFSL